MPLRRDQGAVSAEPGAGVILSPSGDDYPSQMVAKIAVTTHCNGRCKTCPVGFLESRYGETMPFDKFVLLWDILMASPRVGQILLNGTGELYVLPDHVRYLQHVEQHKQKPVILQTNAELLDYVPMVDTIVISYNGGNKDAYEYTTGMSHDQMVHNVRRHYPQLALVPDLQLHTLICEHNANSEGELLTTWSDFPGRIRISYKCENQLGRDWTLPAYRTGERVFCDYLDGLSIWPDGTVISCAHDMTRQTVWGNIFEDGVEGVLQHPDRLQKQREHVAGQWTGLCEHCNYNTPIGDRVRWIQ